MVAVTVPTPTAAPPNLASAGLGVFIRRELQWVSISYTIEVKNGRSKTKKNVGNKPHRLAQTLGQAPD